MMQLSRMPMLGRCCGTRWFQVFPVLLPYRQVSHHPAAPQTLLGPSSPRPLHTSSLHCTECVTPGTTASTQSGSVSVRRLLLTPSWLSTTNRCLLCKESPSSTHLSCSRLVHTSSSWNTRGLYSKKVNTVTPVFLQAEHFLGRTAIVDQHGHFTYDDLLHYSSLLSRQLLSLQKEGDGKPTLEGARVAFLCQNDMSYVVAKWATWIAGGIAVPLCKTHPVSELEYFVEDSGSSLLIATEEFEDKLYPIARKSGIPLKVLKKEDYAESYNLEENAWFESEGVVVTKRGKKTRVKGRFDDLLACNKFKNEPAILIYTSGTTGRPKGVVVTFGNLHAQMAAMISAWEWKSSDVVLHVLPLHHVHGVVNVLMTPLMCGATCVMMPKFDAQQVWAKFINPVTPGDVRINLFMAVPTIYAKLIENFDRRLKRGRASRFLKEYVRSACRNRIRLMVSGSAALPQPIMERWEQISGHRLLERYGMTEIGMALSNPLHGSRVPGTVGTPLPQVEVRIVQQNVYSASGFDVIAQGNSKRTIVTPGKAGESGELQVRGPAVFHRYWNKLEATADSFTKEGWFKTGDTAAYENDVYKIVGRTSVDVIKSGGYKISALDVERHLLSHPNIMDVAVVGLPDLTWGQRVAAVVVTSDGKELTLPDLKQWAGDRLPPYQIPTVLRCLPQMPRNAMGKVNKKTLATEVFPDLLSNNHRR